MLTSTFGCVAETIEAQTDKLKDVNDQSFFEFEDVEAHQRSPHLIPWLVAGMVAVIALLASVIVLNVARGANDEAKPEPTPTSQEPTTPETSEPETEPEDTPEPAENPDDEIDTSHVVVGSVWTLDVAYEGWNIQTDVPNKFVEWTYTLQGDDQQYLVLDSALINSLPESCKEMRNKWGLERVAAGKFEAYSPQTMCEENPALYTEILGLTRAMAETVRPIG